ncbi:PAS domain-containing protein, partial [bacterium]|nr:PAS domain-containing protein [bacterium]
DHHVKDALSAQQIMADQVSTILQCEFRKGIHELESMATLPAVQSMQKGRLDAVLTQFDHTTPFFDYYFVLDPQGTWVSYPSRPSMVGQRIPKANMGWVEDVLERGETTGLDVIYTKIGTLVSGFATPIRDEKGAIAGILRGVMVLSEEGTAQKVVKQIHCGERGYAFVVSAGGRLLAHPTLPLVPERFEEYDYTHFPPVREVVKGKSGVVEYSDGGETWIAVHQPVKLAGWGVVVQQPKRDLYREPQQQALLISGIFAAGMLLAVLLFLFVMHYTVTPLHRLITNIKAGTVPPIETFPRDEIGELAGEFKQLYGRLVESNDALKESESQYRTLIQNLQQSIFLKDTNYTYISVNQSFCALVGMDADAILGKTDADIFSPEQAEKYQVEDKDVLENGNGIEYVEESTLNKNKRWVQVIKTPVKDDDGNITELLGIFWDITDHKKLEEQYRQSQKMEAIGQLAGGIAHDFNNLLQGINGYAYMVKQEIHPDTPVYEMIAQIGKAGDRAAKLVAQLLAFSRRQVLKLEYLDLNDVMSGLINMVERVIGEHIRVIFLPGRQLGVVHADRTQMEQVIINLCINARDAMPEGGTLTIETENVRIDEDYCKTHSWAEPGRFILLSITDTGVGMDSQTLEKIFDPFFTTKDIGKGTGLGLATVYGIVCQHEGMIQAYSEQGKGSTFKIYLPIVERLATSINSKVEGPIPNGKETILLAEDEELVRNLAMKILKRAGYKVMIAADGDEALRLCEVHGDSIDLAILDVVMPKLGGKGVYEKVKDRFPKIKFLFSSGYSQNAIHTNFVLHEGFQLIQKPFSPNDLLRRVRKVLDDEDKVE